MNLGDRVRVIGPTGGRPARNRWGKVVGTVPPSAQVGRAGTVVSVDGGAVAVRLEGEDRPRNFKPADLEAL
jgi:hypothetical protein